MTWQRIDENTYIDDSLVTCAEYQLFIDEMREQGKYYQPDHWTSYQFPRSQGHESVLGVRPSDAQLFCEWLKKRDGDKWNYRLPDKSEVKSIKFKTNTLDNAGYWLNDPGRFSWIRDNKYKITTIDVDLFLQCTNNFVRYLNLNMANSRIKKIVDKNVDSMIGYIHSNRIYLDIDDLNGWVYGLGNIENAISRKPQNAPEHFNKYYPVLISNLAKGIARNKVKVTNYESSGLTIYWGNPKKVGYFTTIDFALMVMSDIFILEERIAGRSPAFEGIRLVKERIE